MKVRNEKTGDVLEVPPPDELGASVIRWNERLEKKVNQNTVTREECEALLTMETSKTVKRLARAHLELLERYQECTKSHQKRNTELAALEDKLAEARKALANPEQASRSVHCQGFWNCPKCGTPCSTTSKANGHCASQKRIQVLAAARERFSRLRKSLAARRLKDNIYEGGWENQGNHSDFFKGE